MEPEGSLPCSQKPATALHTIPDTPVRHCPILFSEIHFSVMLLTSKYLQQSLLFMFSNQNFLYVVDEA
jgi:hypothetical protein